MEPATLTAALATLPDAGPGRLACTVCPLVTQDRYPAVLPDRGGAGAVYLLCFSLPFKGKRHYLGWAAWLQRRLRDHYHGNGVSVPFLKAAYAAGVRFVCVRWWPGDRNLEAAFKYHGEGKAGRAVKGRHGARTSLAYFCPRCCPPGRQPRNSVGGVRLPAHGWIEEV